MNPDPTSVTLTIPGPMRATVIGALRDEWSRLLHETAADMMNADALDAKAGEPNIWGSDEPLVSRKGKTAEALRARIEANAARWSGIAILVEHINGDRLLPDGGRCDFDRLVQSEVQARKDNTG